MPGRRRTRPWGPLRGDTPRDNATAVLLRGWMDEAELTLRELHSALGQVSRGPALGRTTVSDRLAGRYLTGDFIDAVALICFPDAADAKERAGYAHAVLNGSVKLTTDQAATDITARGVPLSLALLQHRVDDFRDGLGDDSVLLVTRLQQENSQLSLNVAELGKRVHAINKELAALTSERDQLRRRCAVVTRELAATRAEKRRLTERLGQQTVEPSPQDQSAPEDTSAEPDEGEVPPTEEWPPRPTGGPSGFRSPGSIGPSAVGSGRPGEQVGIGRSADPAPVADSVSATDSSAPAVPLEFEAFYLTNLNPYLKYAMLRLGDRKLAQEAVEDAFVTILNRWQQLLWEPRLAASAWAVLRDSVASHDSASVTQALAGVRIQLAAIDGAVGLYSAIASLPSRQFDVVVLRFVVGYSTTEIGRLLDMGPSTVDHHLRQAKRRLAKMLNLEASHRERHR